MSNQHVDPEQALNIHKDLRSKLSFGIHWGTFPMGSTEVATTTCICLVWQGRERNMGRKTKGVGAGDREGLRERGWERESGQDGGGERYIDRGGNMGGYRV